MSRSGYSDDCDGWALIRWRGAVNSAIRGARGQSLLRELLAALDAMEVKELVAHEFQAAGSFCALGVVGTKRGIDVAPLIDYDRSDVATVFGIAEALAAEIMHVNDESGFYWNAGLGPNPDRQTQERRRRENRWTEVRQWVESNIVKD